MKRGFAAVRVVGPQHWIAYPALLAVVAVLVFATPVRLMFNWPLPEPVFPMVLAFAWALIRPSMIAPAVLLVLGLFLDLLWITPMGFWALAFLLVYITVLLSRSLIVGQDESVVFFWYAGVTTAAFVLLYVVATLRTGVAPSLIAVGLQWLATVVLFVFANILLQRFDEGEVRFK